MRDPIGYDTFIGLPVTLAGRQVGVVVDVLYDEDGLRIFGRITDDVLKAALGENGPRGVELRVG